MKYTNELGLPLPIAATIAAKEYSAGDADISVTSLIDSSLVRFLTAKHDDELTEDVSDNIYALLGMTVHDILAKASDEENKLVMHEERLFTTVTLMDTGVPYVISGQMDRAIIDLETGLLQDYKVASVWEVIFGIRESRVAQLNLYRYLLEANGDIPPETLQVVMILRDWSKGEAKRKGAEYPQKQVVIIDVPVWDTATMDAYIQARLSAHFDKEPVCTNDDTWFKPGKVAVMKEGRKTALRVLDNFTEAHDWCAENGHMLADGVTPKKGITMVERPGRHPRCEDYCAVSKHCKQYGDWLIENAP